MADKVTTTTVQFTEEMYRKLQLVRERTGKTLRQIVNEAVERAAEELEHEVEQPSHEVSAAPEMPRYSDAEAEAFFTELESSAWR